jgi:hypothetical protein
MKSRLQKLGQEKEKKPDPANLRTLRKKLKRAQRKLRGVKLAQAPKPEKKKKKKEKDAPAPAAEGKKA